MYFFRDTGRMTDSSIGQLLKLPERSWQEFGTLVEMFDKMRKKRNQFTYDPMLPLSLTEAKNALKTADDFYMNVKIFLDKKYPQLKLFE